MTPTVKWESGGTPPDSPLPREAYTLLAQANLLRMRGRWDEAVDKCMSALRLSPENASAQSLLGDIYENQGRTDDAIQWYRMALDVNPESPADKIKLSRLLETKQRQLVAAHPLSDYTPAVPVVQAHPISPGDQWRSPERILRWGAWVVAVLSVLVVVLAGLAMAKEHRPVAAQVQAPNIVLSPPDATDPGQPEAPANADPAEQSLLQILQKDSTMAAQNVTPIGVQMDPRQESVSLTILCPPPAAGISVRDALLDDSVLALEAVNRAQGGHGTPWTIRCLLPGGTDSSPALNFVGDTTPAALLALGPSPSSLNATQILAAFRNVWWSPNVPP